MRWVSVLVLMMVAATTSADDEQLITLIKSKLKDQAKPFTLVITSKVKDGTMSKLEAAFAPCAKITRKEPGCMSYDLHTDPDKPGTIVLIERWKTMAALESHIKQPYTQAFLKTLPEWSAGAPEFKVLLPVE